MDHTIALVHEDDGRFGVSFPDFPGAVTAGASLDDALRRAADTLNFHVAGMIEDGDPLPRVRTLSELRRHKTFRADAKGALLAVIPVELPGRAVRVNISMDERLLAAVDRAAAAAGENRSAFLAKAAKRRLS
jgi:predicted RNase H-like HicB family nuclease